jgi:hypothetical protein
MTRSGVEPTDEDPDEHAARRIVASAARHRRGDVVRIGGGG